MKYLFTFILSLFIGENTSAQTVFMPVGATLSGKGFARGFIGNVVFLSEKDTLCNGTPCRKVNVAYNNTRFPDRSYKEILFIQQRGDSIFRYDDWRNVSGFIFKNNYAVGDSVLLTQQPSYFSMLYIDSVIVSNGVKRFAARRKCVETSNLGIQTSILHLNLYDKLLPDRYPYALACYENDLVFYTPLCYSDSVTSYQTTYYTGRCDSITNITTIEQVSNKLTVFPNPTNTVVTVETTQIQSVSLKIQNINGIIVRQKTAFTPTTIDVQDLPNGLYILSVQADKIPPIIQKIVVHH